CIGKMRDVSSEDGRTILFVSHNMSAIEALCSRAILLNEGHMMADDQPNRVIPAYIQTVSTSQNPGVKYDNGIGVICKVRGSDDVEGVIRQNDTMEIILKVDLEQSIPETNIAIGVNSLFGERITTI